MAIDKNWGIVGNPSPKLRSNVDAARFDELVKALKMALGPCSGLTSEDVDVAYLTRLMEEYNAHGQGWERYAMGDASRGYTRNLVDEGNGKSNLVGIPRVDKHPHPEMANVAIACPRMDPWEGEPYPRSRQCSLPDEDPPREPDRNEIRVP